MESDRKVLHRVLRQLSDWALSSFFTEIRVIGGENVPKDGPIIVYVSNSREIISRIMLFPALNSSGRIIGLQPTTT